MISNNSHGNRQIHLQNKDIYCDMSLAGTEYNRPEFVCHSLLFFLTIVVKDFDFLTKNVHSMFIFRMCLNQMLYAKKYGEKSLTIITDT